MAGFPYKAIFKARMLTGPDQQIVLHPIKIELISTGLKIQIPVQHNRVHVIGKGEKFGSFETLELPKNERLLVVSAKSNEGPNALREVEDMELDVI